MPAKAPLDENVKFLFSCLVRSDYKVIDFTRVAADFSINPSAARMRWSRLKKTINTDDFSLLSTAESPKKAKRTTKQKRDPSELKEAKELAREIHKEKRTERKAKIRAEQKIGAVVKDEETTEEDEDNAGISGYENKDEEMTEVDEQPEFVQNNTIKREDGQVTPEKTYEQEQEEEEEEEEEDITYSFQTDPAFRIFQLPPATPSISGSSPVTPTSSQMRAPESDNEMDKIWGSAITVKNEAGPTFDTASIPIAFNGSPGSPTSSFSPTSSAHTSPAPPSRAVKKSERGQQKWRAAGKLQPQQTRGRPRKHPIEEEEEEEDIKV